MGGRDSRISEPGPLSWEGSGRCPPVVAPRDVILSSMSFRAKLLATVCRVPSLFRGDVTAILQPKILKEIDFAWVQQVVLSFIAKTERVVCRVW